MVVTGTQMNYYFVCHRKLWLFSNNIQMELHSEAVTAGRLTHEQSYLQRSKKYTELELEGIKIDFFDAKNKILHEIKQTDKMEQAHIWQVKYYLYVLMKNNIECQYAILEYPKLRKTQEVYLQQQDSLELEILQQKIQHLVKASDIPARASKSLCKKCAYYEFCWSEEE